MILALFLVSVMAAPLAQEAAARPTVPPPAVSLRDLIEVPALGGVHQFSSRNKEGQNGDDAWHLYDDEDGRAVIFDAAGPGCVRSMWSTDIAEDAVLHFHFDGEVEPRFSIPMLAFYKGEHALFPAPLNSYERRGYWGDRPFAGNSFVPIPFNEHLMITVSGELHFYHVLWQSYPHGTPIETFTGKEDRSFVEEAFAGTWQAPEESVVDSPVPMGLSVRMEGGKEITIFEADEPGVIHRLEIMLEADAEVDVLREVWIRMVWDGHDRYDVNAPLGYFFGSAVRATEMTAGLSTVQLGEDGRIWLDCRFPMPFAHSARIVLANHSDATIYPITPLTTLVYGAPPADRLAYFTTTFREGWTTYGRDWLLAEGPGTGWYVGTVQTMLGEHYCEGDEHLALDGAISPQINGTGTEDYYLGCFWPNREFNSPFACVVGDIQAEGGSMAAAYGLRACYARYHLEAPIPFFTNLDARIQHGGYDTIRSSYGSLAFTYLRPQPALRETDFLDVGNRASEEAHGYAAAGSTIETLEARPEGEHHLAPSRETGRVHPGGELAFTLAIDPTNEGVRLRRRLDQARPRQTAEVFVDGEPAGWWYHANHNEHLRWYDSDFDLHPRFTRGKDRLAICLVVHADGGRGAFTDYTYRAYSYGTK